MALYVAICLLAALIALPDTDAQHAHALQIIWRVTVGLALAHWFAFRVSARLVGSGSVRPHDVESAGAQLAGVASVVLLAPIPVVVFPGPLRPSSGLRPLTPWRRARARQTIDP